MEKGKISKVLGVVLAGILALSAVGCSNKPINSGTSAGGIEGGGKGADSKVTIRIASGPSASANYTTFAGIANLITKDYPNYLISTEISTGSQENVRMINNGTAQFGIAMSDVEQTAAKGTREFNGNPIDIYHVMGGYTTMLHMFVPINSNINSIADLKGHKLAVSKGAMAQYYMPILLEAYGLKPSDVTIREVALQNICDAVNDGNADFGVHITPYISSPIADLAATKGVKMISIDQEHIDKIVKAYPFFYKSVIPRGIYPGVNKDTSVLGTRNNLVCARNIPDEVVYNVVKSIIEHTSELRDVHPQANQFNRENAITGALIDIHPGAARYYKEIGILK
jgi:hypothetical protein